MADQSYTSGVSTITFRDVAFDSVFGKAIPLLIGRCICAGQVFWTSANEVVITSTAGVGQTATQASAAGTISTATPVNFAVAFGKADPLATKSYFSRVWINGQLAYDARGKSPVTSNGLTFTLYDGDEAQQPDPLIAAGVGANCPAFRGLMYMVIQGVDFSTLSAPPFVIAEITQTNDASFKVYTPQASLQSYINAKFDSGSDTLYLIGRGAIDVIDVDGETLLYTLPYGDAGDRFQDGSATYGARFIGSRNYAGGCELFLADLATGAILSTTDAGRSGNGYLPLEASTIAIGANGDVALAADDSYYSALNVFDVSDANIAYRTQIATASGSGKGNFSALKSAPVGAFPPAVYNAAYLERGVFPISSQVQSAGDGASNVLVTLSTVIYYFIGTFNPLTKIPSGGKLTTQTTKADAASTVPGYSVNFQTTTLPDPTFFFTPLDTSKFSVFYGVDSANNKLRRFIVTGGATVAIAQLPSIYNKIPLYYIHANGGYYDAPEIKNSTQNTFEGYADPEIGAGAYNGYNILIGNEPQIVCMSADRDDVIYTPAAGETIVDVYPGPANNPYVGLIIKLANGSYVYRKFDTVWSIQASGTANDFDANYWYTKLSQKYVNTPADMVFVNPPMKATVRDYFSAYDDLAIPAYDPFDNGNLGVPAVQGIKQGQPGGDVIGYGSKGSLVLIDGAARAVTVKDNTNFADATSGAALPNAVLPSATYDSETGLIFQLGPVNFYLNAGVPLGDTTLGNVLTSMMLFAGYTAAQVNVTALASVDIIGAVINQKVGFTSLLSAIQTVFSLDIFDTDDKAHFVRKTRGGTFVFDYEVAEDDLFPASEGDDSQTLEYERAFSGDLPTLQTLEYIDGDNLGSVGTQTAKRTKFPAVTTAADQSADVSVPISMHTADAIYWADAILFDLWAGSLKTTLRLPPDAFALEPGDYLAINRNDGTQEAIVVKKTTLNADRTVSIEGNSLIQFNDFGAPDAQAPTITQTSLSRTTPPVLAIFENVLFKLADDTLQVPLRYTSDQTCSLSFYNDTTSQYQLLSSLRQPAACGKLLSALPAVGETGTLTRYATDYSTSLLVRFTKGQSLPSCQSRDDFLAGKCFMLVGAPGRWELVFYQLATAVDAGRLIWKLTGLRRGRRGTDPFCGASRANDAAIFPASLDSLPLAYAAAPGVGLPIRLAPTGGSGATTLATITPGASHGPWRPCGLACSRTASATVSGRYDYAFTWHRRTRDEADMLHDGDAIVRNEFDAEAYAIQINGNTKATSAPQFTYTAEAQTADGVTADPLFLTVAVAQIGNGVTGPAVTQFFTF